MIDEDKSQGDEEMPEDAEGEEQKDEIPLDREENIKEDEEKQNE